MMLESEETEIGIAIREVLGGERTSRLFALYSGKDEHDGKEISPFLKEIVSSQLDVDRMDYMIRDQANSGAQIGGFDSARVIRALRVGDNGHLYAKQWGLPAIEAYLVTRYHLYNQVYFHKVNQLTQEYLVGALSRARELAKTHGLFVGISAGANILAAEKYIVNKWVNENFGEGWKSEVDVSFSKSPISTFIAVKDQNIIG